MLNVPRRLPNKLEYKFLGGISVHYQSRMTSNGIVNTPSRFHSAGRQGKIAEDGGGNSDVGEITEQASVRCVLG